MTSPGEAAGTVLLRVEEISKSFGGVRAVDACSFEVHRGEIVGLIGPNGAGKSTVVEVTSGFLAPDAGRIVFEGQEIQGWPPHKVFGAGLARCFQLAREWPELTVLENVLAACPGAEHDSIRAALFARRRLRQRERLASEQALDVIHRYGLARVRNDYAGTLSGGQKRLLEFARIAVATPRLALLDEPMAGVNPVLRKEIESGVEELRQAGTTVLLIEHDLAFVERICSRVIAMVWGHVVASGSMADLRSNEAVQDAYLGEQVHGG